MMGLLGLRSGIAAIAMLPLAACTPQPAACPAIAAAPVVTIHVSPDRAATLASATFTGQACQDGACSGGPLELLDDSGASATPGWKRASIMMPRLTTSPVDVTLSGADLRGDPLGDQRVTVTPREDHPFGPQCPSVLIVEVTFDAAGLRAS
jgi:hypothetical protein